MSDARTERLAAFVDWAHAHVTGDEKGQAQIFLDRLFQAFGRPGCLDIGGTTEFRVRKSVEDGGGVAFADYVWKPVVLVEMKRRGVDLAQHFRQAFDYWVRLVPDRPQYVVLCNFDEFWIYDFNVQMDSPVDKVALDELPERCGPLAFLFPTNETPVFGNDHEAVTRKAADHLGRVLQQAHHPPRRARNGAGVHPPNARRPIRRRHRPAAEILCHAVAGRLQNAIR